MHDLRADRFEEKVNLIDVAMLARAQTYVMQSDAPLHELLRAIRVVAAHDSHGGPPAHAVQKLLAAHDRLEPKVHEQLLVERKARLEIADREHHVRDAVDFHFTSPSWLEDLQPLVAGMSFFDRVVQPSSGIR